MAIFTLLPTLRYEAWYIRGFDFPRLQFSILLIFLLILQCIFLDFSSPMAYGLVLVSLFCLGCQLWRIVPYMFLFPIQVGRVSSREGHLEDYDNISILTANVQGSNRRAADFLDIVKRYNPDIILTLESNKWWQSQLDTLEASYPYTIKCPLENLYGMHVYSKLPLSDSQIQFLVEDNVPSMHTLVQTPQGHMINAHFLHPAPPSPTENDTSEERDAELLVVAEKVKDKTSPIIVAGDFNDVTWSRTTRLFRKVSGLLDPRIGRGLFNTFHAKYWFIRWPLDHLFHSKHFKLLSIQRLQEFGSDHFPLLIHLQIQAQVVADESTESLAPREESVAQEKTAQQNVDVSDVASLGSSK
ncbi:endonuclease/exonuclease/phosphatase family protein [Microbulbifer sp. THAF38]|uniref:endonuclease/exonuclease/phosphatase family protein n=1 Tax=Microbulbifer sp. THAF38 TaxID=2587856 RepID=UPI001C12BBF5|nr:endonuclease/exonuclease/phosphatase family protein [Microbulbifer sp. THAF38]